MAPPSRRFLRLARLMDAWPTLPDALKTSITAMVTAASIESGEFAILTALLDEEQRAERRRREEADQIDHELAQIDDALRSLTAAMLEEAGYHRYKGQWRKQRPGRRESTNEG